MKLNITKEEYEALSEDLKSAYTQTADGFGLQVEGIEDTGALKRAKDHEKKARLAAEEQAKALKEQIDSLQGKLESIEHEGSRKNGDIEALETSYKKKLAEAESKFGGEISSLHKTLERRTVDAEAMRLATELSGDNAHLILPHVRAKLGFELADGDVKVRVLGDDGAPSADSLDDLKNFYFTDERFSPIVIGSKASGSGAVGAKGSGGATRKRLSDMTATEEAVFANQNPNDYAKMLEAETAST